MDKTVYIHYGHTEFDETLFNYEVHTLKCKPTKGLWASRLDAEYGWKDWCEVNDFRECDTDDSFLFTLSSDAKILEVHKEEDILPYIIRSEDFFNPLKLSWQNSPIKTSVMDGIDFQKIMSEGYDGMELFLSDDYSMHRGVFYSWDCDSIVVWNSNVIAQCDGFCKAIKPKERE